MDVAPNISVHQDSDVTPNTFVSPNTKMTPNMGSNSEVTPKMDLVPIDLAPKMGSIDLPTKWDLVPIDLSSHMNVSNVSLSRKSYTAEQKLEMVEFAEIHGNRKAARVFCINESSIRGWRKAKHVLISLPKCKKALRGKKSNHKALKALENECKERKGKVAAIPPPEEEPQSNVPIIPFSPNSFAFDKTKIESICKFSDPNGVVYARTVIYFRCNFCCTTYDTLENVYNHYTLIHGKTT